MIIKLTQTFLRMFFRDRRAIIFSLFFPLVFMAIFGFINNRAPDAFGIGIADHASNALSAKFTDALMRNPLFKVTQGDEAELRQQVQAGKLKLALVVPASFADDGTPTQLPVIVDAAQVRELALVLPVLEQALVDAERSLRNTQALFTLKMVDVKARAQNYLSFVVPGLLAMSLMSISIAGSGFNIVEYRRKGILKRLFVTPIQPKHFIGGLVLSRALICVIQLGVVLLIGMLALHLQVAGSLLAILVVILLGTSVFLSIGFCLGSIAKTQETIQAIGNLVTFPQMLLSGIFYPIDSLPQAVQPIAQAFPLSFVANGLRSIIVDGAGLLDLGPTLLGLAIWGAITLVLAIRMFVWKEVAA
ncbi:MAG TPA: ABC transporter permease [Candidatus Acidoferrum sp.]|nr:ABC transporter permease [Candidatus Acidoferrum sp.]